jgi:hypothetical protein
MKPKSRQLSRSSAAFAILLIASIASGVSQGAITITNTGTRNTNFTSGTTLATMDFSVLSSTTNTAVFFVFQADAGNATPSATFAGQAMTVVAGVDRNLIGYLANPTSKSGNIVVTTGTSSEVEIAYWGLAQGIDTSSIKTAIGSSIVGTTQTNATLSSLNVGDVVISGFAVNNFTAAAYSGGLISHNGSVTGYDSTIRMDTVVTAGNFAASTTVASGAGTPTGASIAFTAAIPEPASAGLIGIAGMLGLLRRRRT